MAVVTGRARHAAARAAAAGVIRSFVAVLLAEPIRLAVTREIERLRPLSRAVAWVPPENLHLTLQFLGEQSEARLEDAAAALAEVLGLTPSFEIALHGVGAFPGLERPRILWVGVAQGALETRALQRQVATALETRSFAREGRPWHPHLTIGRVFDERRWRHEAGPELRSAIARAAATGFGRMEVAAVALMRSDLSPAGARYRVLRSVALTGS